MGRLRRRPQHGVGWREPQRVWVGRGCDGYHWLLVMGVMGVLLLVVAHGCNVQIGRFQVAVVAVAAAVVALLFPGSLAQFPEPNVSPGSRPEKA